MDLSGLSRSLESSVKPYGSRVAFAKNGLAPVTKDDLTLLSHIRAHSLPVVFLPFHLVVEVLGCKYLREQGL